jgi:hypothetical protein
MWAEKWQKGALETFKVVGGRAVSRSCRLGHTKREGVRLGHGSMPSEPSGWGGPDAMKVSCGVWRGTMAGGAAKEKEGLAG